MADENKGETPETKEITATVIEPIEAIKPKTVEDLQAEIERLGRTNKNKVEEAERVHKKLEAFETAEAKRKEAEMSELEKAQAEVERLNKVTETATATANQKTLESLIVAEAAKLDFADPADAVHFVPADVTAENVKTTLEALAKSKEYLIKKTTLQSGKSANPSAAGEVTESDAEKRRRLIG